MVQEMFESFSPPSVYIGSCPVLSLYETGRITGVVLDAGDTVTYTVPAFEGFSHPHAIERIDLGGKDITNYLMSLLNHERYDFHSDSEFDILREAKEKVCFVSENPSADVMKFFEEDLKKEYMLPDGQVVEIDTERFLAPEILFNPGKVKAKQKTGIHTMCHNSIQKCDSDIRNRLYGNIIVSGGSSLFPGLERRLLKEIKALAPGGVDVKVVAPQNRHQFVWIGGSILASLSSFENMWISRRVLSGQREVQHEVLRPL